MWTFPTTDRRGFLCRDILIILAVGLVVRYVVGVFLTYSDDVQSWALTIANFEAGGGLYGLAGYNYAPPWGYILGFVSVIGEFFGVDMFGSRLTDALPAEQYSDWVAESLVPSLEFALMVKTVFFVSDILVGYLVYRIIMDRCDDQRKAVIGFGLWFLCPFVITAGAAQGMFDTISENTSLTDFVNLPTPIFLTLGHGGAALAPCTPIRRELDLECGLMSFEYAVEGPNGRVEVRERRLFSLARPDLLFQRGLRPLTRLISASGGAGGISAAFQTRHTGLGLEMELRFRTGGLDFAAYEPEDGRLCERFTGRPGPAYIETAARIRPGRCLDPLAAAEIPGSSCLSTSSASGVSFCRSPRSVRLSGTGARSPSWSRSTAIRFSNAFPPSSRSTPTHGSKN